MNISKVIMVMLILTSLITGCVETGIEGKYYNVNDTDAYIELNSDGTFVAFTMSGDRQSGISGTYKIENSDIILSIPMGMAAKGTIKGQDIIIDIGGPDGDIYRRR